MDSNTLKVAQRNLFRKHVLQRTNRRVLRGLSAVSFVSRGGLAVPDFDPVGHEATVAAVTVTQRSLPSDDMHDVIRYTAALPRLTHENTVAYTDVVRDWDISRAPMETRNGRYPYVPFMSETSTLHYAYSLAVAREQALSHTCESFSELELPGIMCSYAVQELLPEKPSDAVIALLMRHQSQKITDLAATFAQSRSRFFELPEITRKSLYEEILRQYVVEPSAATRQTWLLPRFFDPLYTDRLFVDYRPVKGLVVKNPVVRLLSVQQPWSNILTAADLLSDGDALLEKATAGLPAVRQRLGRLSELVSDEELFNVVNPDWPALNISLDRIKALSTEQQYQLVAECFQGHYRKALKAESVAAAIANLREPLSFREAAKVQIMSNSLHTPPVATDGYVTVSGWLPPPAGMMTKGKNKGRDASN